MTASAKEPPPNASPPPSSRFHQQFGKDSTALVENFYQFSSGGIRSRNFFRREGKTGRAKRTIPVIMKVRDMGRVRKMVRFP
jgi:hypothetical protein